MSDGQLTSEDLPRILAQHGVSIMTAQDLSGHFLQWARAAGLLERITEQQCADLAAAYLAGYLMGVPVNR